MGKTWRKVSLLTVMMGTCFAAGVWASDGIEKVEAFLRPDFHVLIDGKPVTLDKPVLLYDDSSYLPLRKISELLNADVKWVEDSRSIYINTRYAGQPTLPDTNTGPYAEISVKSPFPYQATYLGGSYTLVSAMAGPSLYYREHDLALMGVDTRGLTKSKDTNTGMLYVHQEDVNLLWKEMPSFNVSLEPLVAGTTDPGLIAVLKDMAKNSLPLLGKAQISNYPVVTKINFVDAVLDKPGWFAAYGTGEKGEPLLYMIRMEKGEKDGIWRSKSVQTISLDFYKKFFEDK
jgi:hypothetical protein